MSQKVHYATSAIMKLDEAIHQFLEYLEVEKNFSSLTINSYGRYLRRFSDWLEQAHPSPDMDDVTADAVRLYRLHLARRSDGKGARLKKGTQSYHLIALRALLRYLSVHRGLSVLAPDRIELPKASPRTVSFLATEDVERLASVPDTSGAAGLRDRAILETLFSTGLRVSELSRLNRDQIDLEGKELGVVGKGGRPRVVFLSDEAAYWIRRYLKLREDSFRPLFIRYAGRQDASRNGDRMRLTARSIQRIVRKYARITCLPTKVTPHTLRHSFATDLLMGGADIRSVQQMLGHQSITTTQVYTHVTDSHLKDVHRRHHGRRKGSQGD